MTELLLVWTFPLLVLSGQPAPARPKDGTPRPEAASARTEAAAPQAARAATTRARPRPSTSRPRSPARARARTASPREARAAARAQPQTKVLAVVNLSAPVSRDQVRWTLNVYTKLRKALAGTWPSSVSPIDDFGLRAVLAGDRPDWSLQQAKALLAKARVAYATLKIQQALTHLEAARELLLRQVPVERAKGPLAQVWAYLVMCRNSLGQADLAKQEAAKLALVSPSGQPLPEALWKRYRPSAPKRGAGRTKRARRHSRRSTLQIQLPSGARAYLDFKPLEPATKTPATAPTAQNPGGVEGTARYDITVDHLAFFAVDGPGIQHYFTTIQPGTKSLRVVLVPAPKDKYTALRQWIDGMRGHSPSAEEIRKLSQKVAAGLLLLVRADTNGISLALYDRHHPGRSIWTETLPAGKDALWPKLETRRLAGLARLLSPPKPRPTRAALARAARKAARKVATKKKVPIKKPKKKPLWKKWYFWVALGAVAVAATVFAVTKDKQGDEVDIRVSKP